jgi:CDP-2,3-bis-(O-geranylgeranyl)-sn-glycerol synthase
MLNTIIQALYFFLPAYAANAAPVIFSRFDWWKPFARPVDMNVRIGGQSLFGVTKTWRGIISGVVAGVIVGVIQFIIHEAMPSREYLYLFRYTIENAVLIGFLMGLGEGLGDLAKSFIKRRMNLKSGAASFPLDQTSFIGALLLSLVVYMPPAGHIWAIVLISPLIPVIANLIAYRAGLKKVWW